MMSFCMCVCVCLDLFFYILQVRKRRIQFLVPTCNFFYCNLDISDITKTGVISQDAYFNDTFKKRVILCGIP